MEYRFNLLLKFRGIQQNKNYKFIFTIIDNHTNYAQAIPLKDKSRKRTATALKSLIEKAKRKHLKIWSD